MQRWLKAELKCTVYYSWKQVQEEGVYIKSCPQGRVRVFTLSSNCGYLALVYVDLKQKFFKLNKLENIQFFLKTHRLKWAWMTRILIISHSMTSRGKADFRLVDSGAQLHFSRISLGFICSHSFYTFILHMVFMLRLVGVSFRPRNMPWYKGKHFS